jgi:hypothetical protein
MNKCSKCGRTLKNPSATGMGPVCARAAYGTKPRQERRTQPARDCDTNDLFPEALRFTQALAGISLEMPA